MECRRRLGKRKITNVSDAISIPIHDFGPLWGAGRAVDRSQWQWEAPSAPSQPVLSSMPLLPTWLAEYEQSPADQSLYMEHAAPLPLPSEAAQRFTRKDLKKFRLQLSAAHADAIPATCDKFYRELKQSMALGLVSEELMSLSLRYLTKHLGRVSKDRKLVTSLRLAFYLAVWEGLKACRVMGPLDVKGSTLNRLVLLSSRLEQCQPALALAYDIVCASSVAQLSDMEPALSSLVVSSLLSWGSLKFHYKDQSRINDYIFSCPTVLGGSAANARIGLGDLPSTTAKRVIQRSTLQIMEHALLENTPIGTLRVVRYRWLRIIASVPCVTEELLIELCLKMDLAAMSIKKKKFSAKSYPLSLYESCQILLSFWTGRGELSKGLGVRREFEHRTHHSASTSGAALCLLSALNSHRELCWTKAQSLFRFLRCLGRPHMVYKVMHTLIGSNVKLPASLVAKEINLHEPNTALLIYRLYPKIRHGNEPLLLDGCEGLILRMINDCSIHPTTIWGALGIPLFHPQRLRFSNRVLPQARVDLVHKMALAFATSRARSSRVAFRNVMQCAMYLRRHNVPISVELTRALCHVGITRELVQNHWVGTEKLIWLLDLIEAAEGQDVAENVDRAVYRWRERLYNET